MQFDTEEMEMEQNQELTHIGSLSVQIGMPSTRPLQMRQTSSTEREMNELRGSLKRPPLVIPKQRVETLIRVYFANPDDYADMVKHLETFQKTRAEWDHYRQKIPSVLLQKWGELLNACRESGYIAPSAKGGKIVFRQIISSNGNADQCTLCNNNIIAGTCKGKLRFMNGKKTFVFCWG